MFLERFKPLVQRRSHHPAVVDGGGLRTTTYGELNELSLRAASVLLDSGLERQEKQNNDRFFPLAFNLSKPCLWRRRSTYLSSMTVLPEKTIRRSEGSSREHVSGKIAENVSFFGLTARSRLSSRMEIFVLRSLFVIVMMRTPSFREISQIIQLFYDS